MIIIMVTQLVKPLIAPTHCSRLPGLLLQTIFSSLVLELFRVLLQRCHLFLSGSISTRRKRTQNKLEVGMNQVKPKFGYDTLSREIKHPLSKRLDLKNGGGGLLTHHFSIHMFWVFPPRNKKKAQNFLAASPREFFVKKRGCINPRCFIFTTFSMNM